MAAVPADRERQPFLQALCDGPDGNSAIGNRLTGFLRHVADHPTVHPVTGDGARLAPAAVPACRRR